MKFKLRKGLELPITGEAKDQIDEAKSVNRVAVLGSDYVGMKPTMLVKVGDQVKAGQPLFSCKKNIGLTFTSPAAGKVVAINRGDRRVFQSIEIAIDGQEHVSFKSYGKATADAYSAEEAKALLIESGQWTCLRQRPFGKVAEVTSQPHSIFITAMDSQPLAPNPVPIIKDRQDDFDMGIELLAKLTEGKTYLCQATGSGLTHGKAESVEFSGPHPAGNAGTHIHFVDPVTPGKTVWHIGYQDVITVGCLVRTGQLDLTRVISLAGPNVKKPRLLKTMRGANIDQLIEGEVLESSRVISGSVLNGHTSEGAFAFLGHYANQVSVIEEDDKRELLGWHKPGFDQFSVKSIYLSKLMPSKKFALTSSTNGSLRAMVPIGSFEKVTPLDILPTQLLRALASQDTETAQELGCLELIEEDLSLYTFAAPGKVDFGPMLRDCLNTIERDG